MAIYLYVKDGDEETRVRLTGKPLFIGRSSKCHITLKDSMISGKHLAVKVNSDGRAVIKDLETTNGTFLNGSKIQETFIYLDDFIQIGKVKITLDDSEMNAKELGLHKRDFERTSVTFVRLGAKVEGIDDVDEDEFGPSKQKTLLAKIRKKQEIEEHTQTVTKREEPKPEREAPKQQTRIGSLEELELKGDKKKESKKSKRKKTKKVQTENVEEENGILGKLKSLFKKD
jgi:pSer/pThr/pTyr-binding forkhead associated (FHA) protein